MSTRVHTHSNLAGLVLALGVLFLGSVTWGPAEGRSSSASYHIPRQTIDAGAARASSASYTLNGSIGQPDAGPAMSSGSFRLTGGFQRGNGGDGGEPEDRIFADRFQGN